MAKGINFTRQMGLLPPDILNRYPYVLIGAGGIGSPIGFTIAKMGVENLTIWDSDKIENHNLPNQFYKLSQLGKNKAESLAANISEYSLIKAVPMAKDYSSTVALNGVVISAVHSIDGRKDIWQGVKKSAKKIPLYVETRMAGELFQVYPVPMADKERVAAYEEKLYRKAKVHVAACTQAAIFYTVMSCAGVVGEAIKMFLTDPGQLPKAITVDLKRYRMMVE